VNLIRAFVRNLRTWLALLREKAQAGALRGPKVPMGQTGADCFVVPRKRHNGRGGKGQPRFIRFDSFITCLLTVLDGFITRLECPV